MTKQIYRPGFFTIILIALVTGSGCSEKPGIIAFLVFEDCAHKHCGEWNVKKAGSIGDIGSFIFQLYKHLKAGEGGALKTNSFELAEKPDALRNCGRSPIVLESSVDKGAGQYTLQGNFIQSLNFRITEFRAAIIVEGLKWMPEQNHPRDENGVYLNSLLEKLPGARPIPIRRFMTMVAALSNQFIPI